jgi:hypothetical protein
MTELCRDKLSMLAKQRVSISIGAGKYNNITQVD